jgi:hypothetical protein
MVDYKLLRVGNVIEYRVLDEQDEPKEQWVRNVVDVDDLLHLMENPDDENYRYMKLTEKEVIEFGFSNNDYKHHYTGKEIKAGDIFTDFVLGEPHRMGEWNNNFTYPINEWKFVDLEYVHELQNLFLDMVGEHLVFPSQAPQIVINPLEHEQTK